MFTEEFDTFYKLDLFSNTTRSTEFTNHINKVVPNVLMPLKNLIDMYSGPNKLIEKRNDKLLDYEGAMSDLELKRNNNVGQSTREIEKNVEKTKKDYEALNLQLLEELPILTFNSCQILNKCVEYFKLLNGEFLNLISSSFKEIIKVNNFIFLFAFLE